MVNDGNTPEFYSDVFDFGVTPYGVTVTFGVTARPSPGGEPAEAEDQAVVRMSLEQAKILSMLLRKTLRGYEREHELEIGLPRAVYISLGLAPEDWPPVSGT